MLDAIDMENEILMRNLRKKLDMNLFNLLKFDPKYYFYGNKENQGYNFYIKNRNQSLYRIEFTFKVWYEDELDILSRYEKENYIENISDEELDDILKRIKDIKYVTIYGLYITPKNTGMGTRVINCFLDELKKIGKIDEVYLHPDGLEAENFWSKLGFSKYRDYKKWIHLSGDLMVLKVK